VLTFATLFDVTLNAALLVLSALKAVAAIPFRLTRRIPNALLPAIDVASLMPSGNHDFALEIKGFCALRDVHQGGRVCRAGHELPALCAAKIAPLSGKSRGIGGKISGPALALSQAEQWPWHVRGPRNIRV
jgi:hypothetical protein